MDQISTGDYRNKIVNTALKHFPKRKQGNGILNSVIDNLPLEVHLPGYEYLGPGTNLDLKLSGKVNPICENRSCNALQMRKKSVSCYASVSAQAALLKLLAALLKFPFHQRCNCVEILQFHLRCNFSDRVYVPSYWTCGGKELLPKKNSLDVFLGQIQYEYQ